MKAFHTLATLLGCLALSAAPAHAATIVLDFEGLQDSEYVWNFYDGGDGSLGSTGGTDYGVEFGRPEFGGARTAIDTDAGGTGRFENEPSPNTVVQFFHFNPYMYVDAGFETALSFWYSTSSGGFIRIYDASNTVLAQMSMAPTSGTCSAPTDPDNLNVCWSTFAVPFSGTATRVEFAGLNILYDDITLGSTVPGVIAQVPEPASLLLFGTSFAGLAVARRQRIRQSRDGRRRA